jgi:hypothetical protein
MLLLSFLKDHQESSGVDAHRKLGGAGKKFAIYVNPQRPIRAHLYPPHEGRFYPAQPKMLSRPHLEEDGNARNAGIMANSDEV